MVISNESFNMFLYNIKLLGHIKNATNYVFFSDPKVNVEFARICYRMLIFQRSDLPAEFIGERFTKEYAISNGKPQTYKVFLHEIYDTSPLTKEEVKIYLEKLILENI